MLHQVIKYNSIFLYFHPLLYEFHELILLRLHNGVPFLPFSAGTLTKGEEVGGEEPCSILPLISHTRINSSNSSSSSSSSIDT